MLTEFLGAPYARYANSKPAAKQESSNQEVRVLCPHTRFDRDRAAIATGALHPFSQFACTKIIALHPASARRMASFY